jgi:hypothetical protein
MIYLVEFFDPPRSGLLNVLVRLRPLEHHNDVSIQPFVDLRNLVERRYPSLVHLSLSANHPFLTGDNSLGNHRAILAT